MRDVKNKMGSFSVQTKIFGVIDESYSIYDIIFGVNVECRTNLENIAVILHFRTEFFLL